MDKELKEVGAPLPLVVDTIPGRNLRTTAIDQYIYSEKEGNQDSYPLSPWAGKNLKDIYFQTVKNQFFFETGSFLQDKKDLDEVA